MMYRLAFHPATRALLHCAVHLLRPLRFQLGISQRIPRELEELLWL